MSGLLNSTINGSTSNHTDSTGRPFAGSFSSQPTTAPGYHHTGGVQGLHSLHGSFNVPSMPGSLASRSAAMSGGVMLSGVPQPGGSISSGRFASNNHPVAMSQISHGSSHGHAGLTNRGGLGVGGAPGFGSGLSGVGGSIPGISSNSATIGERSSVPGLGVSPILGNVGPRMTSSMNYFGGGSIGRMNSAGISVPSLGSRVNLAANSGSAGLSLQNRYMGGMLQQAPQMIGMLGNSYSTSGGPLGQNQVQSGNNALASMVGMLNDVNPSDNSPFDMNDFPQLSGRPSSAGGPQGQLGSLRKQGAGVSSIVQQSQEFSIQNEDFPALSVFKGGSSDFSIDVHQKEQQMHDNVSLLQPQQFSMGRSAGFNLGGTYPSSRQQQQQHGAPVNSSGLSFAPGNNQDLLHLHGSDLFPSSHSSYHSQIQNSGATSMGLRALGSTNSASGMGATYEQLLQQYQQPQNQSQFRLQQMSQTYRDQSLKSLQQQVTPQGPPDPFGLLGLLSVIKGNDPELASLAMGIDLTTLGLSLNSPENLYKTFGSPWTDEPTKGEPEYTIPACYNSQLQRPLQQGHFPKFHLMTLLYIFYSMPQDEAQLYAAAELYTQGWYFHKEHQCWFARYPNTEPLVKNNTHERGTYLWFNPNLWEITRKDNVIISYDSVERKPTLPPVRSLQ